MVIIILWIVKKLFNYSIDDDWNTCYLKRKSGQYVFWFCIQLTPSARQVPAQQSMHAMLHCIMSKPVVWRAELFECKTVLIHFHFWYTSLLLFKHKLVSCFEQCECFNLFCKNQVYQLWKWISIVLHSINSARPTCEA